VNFTASAEGFRAATEEYREIWANEGSRIVAAMERATRAPLRAGAVRGEVYQGTSYSGERGGRPMLLRASYPTETKRGTLVHELAHRLAADMPFKGDDHELIFLFVYDRGISSRMVCRLSDAECQTRGHSARIATGRK
jgi:hypothetical protein